jgi:diguanylate cyclase (GGDEF)-like protein
VLDGIEDYAKSNDIHLTVYVGTYQTIDHQDILLYETCFAAIRNSPSLDGLILLSGFITHNYGLDKISKELAAFQRNIPTISISVSIPGVPAVMTDNVNGFAFAVEHLIKVHNKSKIAVVSGPEGHTETNERLEGYKLALTLNNIEYDERYVLPGNFTLEGGHKAVCELIDKRGLYFDAIAVSDDKTAMGVINELRKREVLVPATVAVTGFDDDEGSDSFIPSITTVKQSFTKIGRISAEKLYKKINGVRVKKITTLTPALLARQSCGCIERDILDLDTKINVRSHNAYSLYTYINNSFTNVFKTFAPQQKVQGWALTLVIKLIEKPFNKDSFLKLVDEILVDYNHYSGDYSPWQDAMGAMTMGVELHSDEIECISTVLSTLIRAATLVHNISTRSRKNNEFALDEMRMVRRRIASRIASVFDIDYLAEELHRLLPNLSLNSALIGLYQNHIITNDPDGIRKISTLTGFDGNDIITEKISGNTADSLTDVSEIIDFSFEDERRSLFFFPLFFEDEEMGIVLLPYDKDVHIDTYETLRINLSSAVKGAQMLAKIQTLSLTDELTGLLNRRGFYQFASSRLQLLSRNPEIVTIVFLMDMDGLKSINDTFGHAVGDAAICAFVEVIKKTLREVDIIGRLGGDEFVIFSSVRSANDDLVIMNRIRENLDEYNKTHSPPFKLSTSIGSVVLAEATQECLDAAIQNADSVLYREKTKKRKQGLSRK